MTADELMIPDFLKRERGEVIPKFRAPRWKRMPKPTKPEGEKWEKATRWEVTLQDEVPKLGSGRRRVWVVTGRKWARLMDGGASTKVPMSAWAILARNGQEVA